MRFSLRNALAAALVGAWAAFPSDAQVLVSADDAVHGSGAVTVDLAQGLEFLDLTFTDGLSVAQVLPDLAPGGAYEGWRLATLNEVQTLINGWGFSPAIPLGYLGIRDGDTGGDQLSGFVDLVGVTSTATIPLSRMSGGFVDPASPGGLSSNYFVRDLTDPNLDDFAAVASVPDAPNTSLGVWLVRDSAYRPTFQGRLTDGGQPVDGKFDLELKLLQGGTAIAGPETVPGVVIENGLLTVDLPFDAGAYGRPNVLLRVAVRDEGGTTTVLSPDLPLAVAPRAARAVVAERLDGVNPADTAEDLRMIRGSVSAAGDTLRGAGFTSHRSSPGNYLLTFDTPFAVTPTPVVTTSLATGVIACVDSLSAGSFRVRIQNLSGSAVDQEFHFVVLGLR